MFVQTHREINQKLVAEAVRHFPEGDSFVELYAEREISVCISPSVMKKASSPKPIRLLAMRCEKTCRIGKKTLDIRHEPDTSTVRFLSERPPAPLLLADPPRSGLKALFPLFASAPPRRVLMISCHPMAALRDMAALVHDFGYVLKTVTPFDMFPQTHHLEVLAVLDR